MSFKRERDEALQRVETLEKQLEPWMARAYKAEDERDEAREVARALRDPAERESPAVVADLRKRCSWLEDEA